MYNSMAMFNFWENYAQKIKVDGLSWKLVPRPTSILII